MKFFQYVLVVAMGALMLGSFTACTASDEALDRAVDRYMEQKVERKKLIAELVKEELAKQGTPAPSRAAPSAAPSIEAQLKNPAKVNIAGAPIKGAKKAKVTIVEFSDFQCPFCSRVNPTIAQLLKDYKGKVKVAFKHRPLSFHKSAKPAAIASMAAHKQGKFWEMHDKLFANQRALTQENFEKWAQEIGLNVSKFKKDMADPKIAAQVDADDKEAQKLGASGTPTFFVNGVKLVGAKPIASFKEVIDKVLK